MFTRKFLCDSEADSYVRINTWSEGYPSSLGRGGAEVKIADCDRNVKLQFPHWSLKQAKKSLKKLDVLLTALEKFREHLRKSIEDLEQQPQDRTTRVLARRTDR